MQFDVTVFADDLNDASPLARAVEERGFDGLWVAGSGSQSPFCP